MSDAAPELDAELELRCPQPWGVCPAGRLLAKLRTAGKRPSYVHPDNLIELECPDCKVRMRKEGRLVRRVLHRYDFLGQPVETLVVGGDGLPARWSGTRDMEDDDWLRRAACAGMDTLLWFPLRLSPVSQDERDRLQLALATCKDCAVRIECLHFAVQTGQKTGIWGGLTQRQRAASRYCQQLRRKFLARW